MDPGSRLMLARTVLPERGSRVYARDDETFLRCRDDETFLRCRDDETFTVPG